jgi:peptidoglycan hydrolase CwlO-like protein
MNISIIQSAMSVTGAVITIVALLLASALIGYLTAWFYAKSVYTPVIRKLEEEKAELQREVAGLRDNVSRLNKQIDNLNGKIGELESSLKERAKEITELKARLKE